MSGSVISMPFRFNEFGSVESTTDPRKYWRDRVLVTILTKFGERVMRPNFGSDLYTIVFETEASAIDTAQRTINIAFNTWLTPLNLIELVPEFDQTTGFLDITLVYALPNGETDTLTLKAAIFSRTGDLIQEINNGR